MKKNENKDIAPGEPAEKGTGKHRTGSLAVKLLCVCAAFILWLYVMEVESPEYESIIDGITVELTGVDELEEKSDLTIYSGRGNQLSLTVSGKRSVVNKITADDIIATVDVSKLEDSGRHNLKIYIDLPGGLALVEKRPEELSVYVDQADSKTIPLQEQSLNLNLPDDYEIGTVQMETNFIEISGPKNVTDIVYAAVVDVDYSEKTGTFTTTGEIYLIDQYKNRISNPYLRYSPTEVEVTVPIYKSVTVPVEVEFLHGYLNDTNAAVTVYPSEVTIKGDESVMRTEELLAPIVLDEKKITSNSYGRTITLQTAEGTFIDDNINQVQVNVEIDPSIQYMDLTVTDIEATGANGIRYTIEDKELLVTLRGPIQKLGSIRPSDVYAVVDLSGYSAENSGMVTKTPSIIIDAEDAEGVYEVGEYTVQVRIN